MIPIPDSNVGGFNRRRIVDAVTGHRCDHALILPGLDNPHLMFRLNPGIHRVIANVFFELLSADLIQLGPGDGFFGITDDPQLFSYGNSGIAMVSGDHHWSDPG